LSPACLTDSTDDRQERESKTILMMSDIFLNSSLLFAPSTTITNPFHFARTTVAFSVVEAL
jgi:hypothetical protein